MKINKPSFSNQDLQVNEFKQPPVISSRQFIWNELVFPPFGTPHDFLNDSVCFTGKQGFLRNKSCNNLSKDKINVSEYRKPADFRPAFKAREFLKVRAGRVSLFKDFSSIGKCLIPSEK